MSIDARIAHLCPHYIRYEQTEILGGREIIPRSPISGDGLLDLRVDGISIPKEGLRSEAKAVFPSVAPYRVKAGSNTLVVGGAEISEREITVPPKIYRQQDLVDFLNTQLPFPLRAIVSNKGLAITDDKQINKFTLSGSILKTFGFKGSSFRASKKVLFPSWKLTKQVNFRGYKILLSRSISTEGLVDVSYTCEKDLCRRCSGTGVENDIRFDEQGGIEMIEGYDLLYQRVAKVLLTRLGSNPYHQFYGSTAMGLIGQKVSQGVVYSLRESVRRALDDLINVQDQQSRIQTMSLEERVKQVRNVEVSTIGDDETSYLVEVTVVSYSYQPVRINLVFAVPGSIPLDGDLA